MGEHSSKWRSYQKAESLFSAIYIGSIFIILGVIYYIHLPNSLFTELVDFFGSLTLARVPDTGIYLPAPLSPVAHSDLFLAAFQFSLALGIVEVVVLALRFVFNSPIKRKAETISNVVFWFGAAYLVNVYLVDAATINKWFVFWTGIIIIFGLSLIARAFAMLAKRQPEAPREPSHSEPAQPSPPPESKPPPEQQPPPETKPQPETQPPEPAPPEMHPTSVQKPKTSSASKAQGFSSPYQMSP